MKKIFYFLSLFLLLRSFYISDVSAKVPESTQAHIAEMQMDMLILPGTLDYLQTSIKKAENSGAKLIIIHLDTPGGMLDSSQSMVQALYDAKVPVAVFVHPSGSTATSAGVFITMAGHIAAMAPGTTIGAAHPVSGDGSDIKGDMRKKAENMTTAMAKSIAEQRGRNIEWAQKAVKQSSSLTEKDALKRKVIDIVARDTQDLLRQIKGKKIKLADKDFVFEDLTALPVVEYQPSFQQKAINFLANPNVAALLWLAATTGISIELYNPGLIFPGVVGAICLILALAVSQIIPMSQIGIALIALAGVMLVLELVIPSGILGAGAVVALILGMLYLFDGNYDPYLQVSYQLVLTTTVFVGGFIMWMTFELAKSRRRLPATGGESFIGETAKVIADFEEIKSEEVASDKHQGQQDSAVFEGRIFVRGEYWKAKSRSAQFNKGQQVKIIQADQGFYWVE